MDSELLYLNKRLSFHRTMAQRAVGNESRCAHDAFVCAYRARIDELTRKAGSASPGAEPDTASAPRPILPLATAR